MQRQALFQMLHRRLSRSACPEAVLAILPGTRICDPAQCCLYVEAMIGVPRLRAQDPRQELKGPFGTSEPGSFEGSRYKRWHGFCILSYVIYIYIYIYCLDM